MCCCGKPIVNGEPGYSWDGKSTSVYQPHAPTLDEGETLLYDEPGRCGGGLDSHSYHYRVVRAKWGGLSLRVRHGGGEEVLRLSSDKTLAAPLAALDSTGRYWLLGAIYHAHSDAGHKARSETDAVWRTAAAEKRIKTRKLPRQGRVKVWIEEARAKV